MNSTPQPYAASAAGDALKSAAWRERKKQKEAVSTREKTAKAIEHGKQEFADALARPLDLYLDALIAKVEEIMRRGNADAIIEKLNAILPHGKPQQFF